MAKRPETASTRRQGAAPAPGGPDVLNDLPARQLQPGVPDKPANLRPAGDKEEVFGRSAKSNQAQPSQDVSPGNDELNSGKKPQREFSDEVISVAAYFLWLNEGCPHGRDQEHWERAIEDLQHSSQVPVRSA